MKESIMFVHSRCCNAHWELVYDTEDRKYDLVCEICNTPVGPGIEIKGPHNDKCEMCEGVNG